MVADNTPDVPDDYQPLSEQDQPADNGECSCAMTEGSMRRCPVHGENAPGAGTEYAIEGDPGRCAASFPIFETLEAAIEAAGVPAFVRDGVPPPRVLVRVDGGSWQAVADVLTELCRAEYLLTECLHLCQYGVAVIAPSKRDFMVAHVERARVALLAAQRELDAAWGNGPDQLWDAEALDSAKRLLGVSVAWLARVERPSSSGSVVGGQP